MKTVKRSKVYLLVVALVLVLSMTVGLTMAYFSDHTEAKGGKKVALGGQTTIREEQNDNNKVIRIENTGETDVIVRVAVYGPTAITYEDSQDWVQKGDYIYYNKVLPAPEDGKQSFTSKIKASWDVPADLGDDYNVVVVQESEQAVYKDGKVVTPTTTPAWAFDQYAD